MKNRTNKILSASLLVVALSLFFVGVSAIDAIQTLMLKAYFAEGDGGPITQMVTAWPELILPLVCCLSVSFGFFIVASILALCGKLTINLKAKC